MSVVAFPGPSSARPADGADDPTTLGEAADSFLAGIQVGTTRASYAATLGRLVEVAGEDLPVAALTPEVYDAVMRR